MVPLALCLAMAAVPVLALINASSPSPPVALGTATTRRISVLAGAGDEAALARLRRDRASRSDTAETAPTPTTSTPAPSTTLPRVPYKPTLYKAAPRVATTAPARRTTTTRPAVRASAGPATTSKPVPTSSSKPAPAPAAPSGNAQSGGASWYDAAPPGTCAHRTLPKGTVVHITDVSNGATATCTVEDRGPYVDGLVIDLAKDVFSQMAPLSTGVIQVRITW